MILLAMNCYVSQAAVCILGIQAETFKSSAQSLRQLLGGGNSEGRQSSNVHSTRSTPAEASLDWAFPTAPAVEVIRVGECASPYTWDPPGNQYPGSSAASIIDTVEVSVPMPNAACLATISVDPAVALQNEATARPERIMKAHMIATRQLERDPQSKRRLRPFESVVVSRCGMVQRCRTVPIELGKAAPQPAGVAYVRSRELAHARDQPVMRFVPFLGEDEDVDKMRDACVYDARPDLPAAWERRVLAQAALYCACKGLLLAARDGNIELHMAMRSCPRRVLRALLTPRQPAPGEDAPLMVTTGDLPRQLLTDHMLASPSANGIVPACPQARYSSDLPATHALGTCQPWGSNGSFDAPPVVLGLLHGIGTASSGTILRGVTYLVEVPASLSISLHSSMLSRLRLASSLTPSALSPPALGSSVRASHQASKARATPDIATASSGHVRPAWSDCVSASMRSTAPLASQMCQFCFRYACTQHKGPDATSTQRMSAVTAPPAAILKDAEVAERKGEGTVPLGFVLDDDQGCGLLSTADVDPSGALQQRNLSRMLRCPVDEYHLKGFKRLRGRDMLRSLNSRTSDSVDQPVVGSKRTAWQADLASSTSVAPHDLHAGEAELRAYIRWISEVGGCGADCYVGCIGERENLFTLQLDDVGKVSNRSVVPPPLRRKHGVHSSSQPHTLIVQPMHLNGILHQLRIATGWCALHEGRDKLDSRTRKRIPASSVEADTVPQKGGLLHQNASRFIAGARTVSCQRSHTRGTRLQHAESGPVQLKDAGLDPQFVSNRVLVSGIEGRHLSSALADPISAHASRWLSEAPFSIQSVIADKLNPTALRRGGTRPGYVHGDTVSARGAHLPAGSLAWEAGDRATPYAVRGFVGVVNPSNGPWGVSGLPRGTLGINWKRMIRELQFCDHILEQRAETRIEKSATVSGPIRQLDHSQFVAGVLSDTSSAGTVIRAHALAGGCVCNAAKLLDSSCADVGRVLETLEVACWASEPPTPPRTYAQSISIAETHFMGEQVRGVRSSLPHLLDPVADATALEGHVAGPADIALSMRLGAWEGLDRLKTPQRKHSNRRRVMVWCDHDGPCSAETSQCKCVSAGTVCSKTCGCDETCKNRWTGCVCGRKGQVCSTRNGCPCVASGRECDPDVCETCECIGVHSMRLRKLSHAEYASAMKRRMNSMSAAALKFGGNAQLLHPEVLSVHAGGASRSVIHAGKSAVDSWLQLWSASLVSDPNLTKLQWGGSPLGRSVSRLLPVARLVASAPEIAARATVAREITSSQHRHALDDPRNGGSKVSFGWSQAAERALSAWDYPASHSAKKLVAEQLAAQSCSNGRVLSRLHHCMRVGVSAVPHAGYGLFATGPVREGRLLLEYTGERLGELESERRGQLYDARNRSYLFDLDDQDGGVDATHLGNKMRFANHMGKGHALENAKQRQLLSLSRERIGLFSCKPVVPHEEVFFDYGYSNKRANSEKAKHVGWIKDARMAGRVQRGVVSSEGSGTIDHGGNKGRRKPQSVSRSSGPSSSFEGLDASTGSKIVDLLD